MKRKQCTVAGPTEQTQRQRGGRRQPQTSCVHCRIKKIKCDRNMPCHSCVIRGVSCTGLPAAEPSIPQSNVTNLETGPSVLARLDRLERVVFRSGEQLNPSTQVLPSSATPTASKQVTAPNVPSGFLCHDAERQQAAKLLDSTYTRNPRSTATQAHFPRFHVAPASSHSKQAASRYSYSGPAFLMTRDEALLLLHDFCENPFHLLPIIYEPATRSLIKAFYTQLEQGDSGDPTIAALILSIAATSASFSNGSGRTKNVFASPEAATELSFTWIQTALSILDDSQFATDKILEACQARAILAYVVSNVEGCSARYRFLHSCSVAIARDASLHLIDSAATPSPSDDPPTREMKRRLWWHLASTDWLMGFVGGPLDGTYTIQPRHFIVKRPRNLNDNDLNQNDETLTYPLNVPTNVSGFLQRIRLAEITREMIDARPPGLVDAEITDLTTVASLDMLFQTALMEMPPCLHQGAPVPPGAPLHFGHLRDLILLCFHMRRARLHRPFLLHDTDNPCYASSRHQCISSARSVLSLSIEMLEEPSATDHGQGFINPLTYRAGLVISSTFMACAILALNAGLASNRTTRPTSTSEVAEMHAEITRACRALAKAAEDSSFAENLLPSLVGVLKQYKVNEIDDLVTVNSSLTVEGGVSGDDNARGQMEMLGEPADNFTRWNDFFATVPEIDGFDQFFANLDFYCGPT
ncbi:hypothetical protein GGR50DRAFT_630350 [Xylaria sp. CBS 124048]|nr:hypothetical protein GGR50DRAFT_630350 [Xylaria sp. CBS 124048]